MNTMNGEHIILSGNSLELERKKEISEYIKLFLRGGKKWKKNKKEKIKPQKMEFKPY